MKGEIYIVVVREDDDLGRYRIAAMSEEQAGERARTCFRNEFGRTGKIDSIRCLKSYSETPIN